ncbi:MAG: hemin uptake protein HemP [Halocynthiibacter sp.]
MNIQATRPTQSFMEDALLVHSAEDLVGNDRRAVITLKDQQYFLRITRAGKLILTK